MSEIVEEKRKYSEAYLKQALTLLIKINNDCEELDAFNYAKLEFLNIGFIFDKPSEAFDLLYTELLLLLIENQYTQLIYTYYDNFGDEEISGFAMEYALKTKNIKIIKTVLRYGYNDDAESLFLEEISEYKNLELLKLFIKKFPNEFELVELVFITEEIFLYLYNHDYHKQDEYYTDYGLTLYITRSDYNEYIIDYIMRNEDFDILNYENLDKIEYNSIKQKIDIIKEDKYLEMFEDEGINRDIGSIVLGYLFY